MEYKFSDRLANLSGNAIREIFKLLNNPEIISFAGGMPAADCLPERQINEIFNRLAARGDFPKILQYGETEGYYPLRKACLKMLERVGIRDAVPENVLIISGGQQGIDLCFKAFINKGDTILFENPTYLASLHIAKTYEANLVGVDADADGLNIEDLERKIIAHKPKILYLVPTFSNPTGKTINIEKRRRIAEITAKYGIIMVEDDPYSEIRFSGERMPAVKSFDKTGNVVYISSFSKTVAPGLRTGYLYADPAVFRKLTVGKQAVDVHTNQLSQAIIAEFIESGELFGHIESLKPVYKQKKEAMLEAILRYMPEEMSHTDPEGGLFIWCELPKYIDAVAEFANVCALNCAYVPGFSFYPDESGRNTFRLNFSNATFGQIDKGIRAMGGYFKSLIK